MSSKESDKRNIDKTRGTTRSRLEDTAPLWTVEDVAEYLRLEPETVRAMARDGKLPGMKMGRVWRFRRDDIRTWLRDSFSGNY